MWKRKLGRGGVELSAIGLDCRTIAGPFWPSEEIRWDPLAWTQINDNESIRAIQRALELGITFFNTADHYNHGHSERILGKALAGWRDDVVIATGFLYTPAALQDNRAGHTLPFIRRACEASLQRLQTDVIDLYRVDGGGFDREAAAAVRQTLEALVRAGKIRAYALRTDDPDCAHFFVQGPHCAAVQHQVNLFTDAGKMLALCRQYGLASLGHNPLSSGTLAGKLHTDIRFMAHYGRDTAAIKNDFSPQRLDQVEALCDLLTTGGRTMAQGALGWIWAQNDNTIPLPDFRTTSQVEMLAAAAQFGPLRNEQMQQVGEILTPWTM